MECEHNLSLQWEWGGHSPFHFSECLQGRGGKETFLPAGLQIKLSLCSLRVDFQEEKKNHVVTLKTTQKGYWEAS